MVTAIQWAGLPCWLVLPGFISKYAYCLPPETDNYGELPVKNPMNKYLALISNRKGTEKLTFLSDSETKFSLFINFQNFSPPEKPSRL
jgi:hypothetical protein